MGTFGRAGIRRSASARGTFCCGCGLLRWESLWLSEVLATLYPRKSSSTHYKPSPATEVLLRNRSSNHAAILRREYPRFQISAPPEPDRAGRVYLHLRCRSRIPRSKVANCGSDGCAGLGNSPQMPPRPEERLNMYSQTACKDMEEKTLDRG